MQLRKYIEKEKLTKLIRINGKRRNGQTQRRTLQINTKINRKLKRNTKVIKKKDGKSLRI